MTRPGAASLLVGGLLVGSILTFAYLKLAGFQPASRTMGEVHTAMPEEIVVMRTPGGLLEVSTVRARESIETRFTYELLGIPVGNTAPRIRVPVVYRYHIELAPEWRVLRHQTSFTVVTPPVKPSLPVAVDFAGMEKDVAGTWILVPFTATSDLDDLEKSISARLAMNASNPVYLQMQRESARLTVTEFVKKWLITQSQWRDLKDKQVRVLFPDEPIGELGAELLPQLGSTPAASGGDAR